MTKSRSRSYDAQLRMLVELYGVWRAYETVGDTCTLAGFAEMVEERGQLFRSELRRYAFSKYGRKWPKAAVARAMDDVLNARNQLTIF